VWNRFLPVLNCPSDKQLNVNQNKESSYAFCIGDGPIDGNIGTTNPRGMFGFRRCFGVRDILDGASNTIALSEHVKAEFGNNTPTFDTTGTRQTVEGMAMNQTGLAAAPGVCLSTANGQTFRVGIEVKGKFGTLWTDGQSERVAFHTILPPNAPSCAEGANGNADSANSVISASSRHEGGVHCLMGDGAVRFISENISTGNLSAATTGSGPSRYGVWGSLGSKDGTDVVGEF
jgi:hypothetical protein